MATIGEVLRRHLDRPLLAAVHRDLTNALGTYMDAPLAVGESTAG